MKEQLMRLRSELLYYTGALLAMIAIVGANLSNDSFNKGVMAAVGTFIIIVSMIYKHKTDKTINEHYTCRN